MAYLSKEQLQEYCMMFPIAYYAGKPLPLEAQEVATSCANIVNNSIYISVSQVNKMIKEMQHVDAVLIRPLVYHEVSHVILSPRETQYAINSVYYNNAHVEKMRHDDSFADARINIGILVNLFEDERIECLTRNTYMEVNFYESICRLNDWTGPRFPTSLQSAFYDMIRFHKFKGLDFKWHKFYNRSRALIIKWSTLQPESPKDIVIEYVNDIADLYYDFVIEAKNSKEFYSRIINAKEQEKQAAEEAKKREKEEQEEKWRRLFCDDKPEINPSMRQPEENDEDVEDVEDKDDEAEDVDEVNEANPGRKAKQNDVEHGKQAEQQEVQDKAFDNDKANEEDKDDEPLIDVPNSTTLNVETTRKIFNDVVFDNQDENVKRLLNQKFFIKDMHGMQMGAIHKHSGKLDVKAVGRNDWKIFKQPSMFSDGSKIGKKMHLILVLDQSGSYAGNDVATNKILASLISAEEHIKAFEFTVLKFGTGFHVCKKNERYSDSHEGTEFSISLFEQIDKLKRQDSANFIIFLNDGAAWTSGLWDDKRAITNAMKKALDHNNCVCILDYDAHDSWFKSMKHAKVIVTYEYVKKLSNNVCEALEAMLAV